MSAALQEIAAVRRLVTAGMPAPQAEAIVELIRDQIPAKQRWFDRNPMITGLVTGALIFGAPALIVLFFRLIAKACVA